MLVKITAYRLRLDVYAYLFHFKFNNAIISCADKCMIFEFSSHTSSSKKLLSVQNLALQVPSSYLSAIILLRFLDFRGSICQLRLI